MREAFLASPNPISLISQEGLCRRRNRVSRHCPTNRRQHLWRSVGLVRFLSASLLQQSVLPGSGIDLQCRRKSRAMPGFFFASDAAQGTSGSSRLWRVLS